MPQNYEIEIKSLLGSRDKYDALKATIAREFPDAKLLGTNNQLNHYFIGGDLSKLFEITAHYVTCDQIGNLKSIIDLGRSQSVRTRQRNDDVIFTIKASIDDTTSSNGIARIEFESLIPNMTLEQMDKKVLSAGFDYQAKWSRNREEYDLNGTTLCIDKNAGYGYLAEVERVIQDKEKHKETTSELRAILSKLEIEELPQDRLERMFKYYNENWKDYYGTDNIFTVT